MSENTINAALRRLGYGQDEMTGHGFRAMASTLLNEMGKWNSDAIERQLAHADNNSVRRAYLPHNIPAIKRVVGVTSDSVCALGTRISVNGKWIADRHPYDGKGRPMPWWQNCKRLGKDELFLLNEEAANSFDGRYIGISKRSDVIGEASLIWRD